MARVVVVSSMEIEPSTLGDEISADDELFVVVPAVEQSRLKWLTNDEGEARGKAQEIGETIASDAPATATDVEVKPDVPSQLVLDAIAEHEPDRIIVVLREGRGRDLARGGRARPGARPDRRRAGHARRGFIVRTSAQSRETHCGLTPMR